MTAPPALYPLSGSSFPKLSYYSLVNSVNPVRSTSPRASDLPTCLSKDSAPSFKDIKYSPLPVHNRSFRLFHPQKLFIKPQARTFTRLEHINLLAGSAMAPTQPPPAHLNQTATNNTVNSQPKSPMQMSKFPFRLPTMLDISLKRTAIDPQKAPPQSPNNTLHLRGGDRSEMCPGRFCFIIPCPIPCDCCII